MSSAGKTGRPGEAARAGTILTRARIRLAMPTILKLTSVYCTPYVQVYILGSSIGSANILHLHPIARAKALEDMTVQYM